MVAEHDGREIDRVISEIGPNPIFELAYEGRRLAVMHPGVGAPLAVGFMEEPIARGVRAFVAFGGAGVLVPDVALGHVIVPTGAIRDEGTSYHYMPAEVDVAAAAQAVEVIVTTVQRHHGTGLTRRSRRR